MRKEKGVTLVALVVTIIVLIILAGISINLILGDNGIITIAKKAKENTELTKRQEETELNELYTQLENNEWNSEKNDYDAIAKLTEFKTAIANAIDEAGGIKPEVSAETAVFANSIKGILKEVTKEATATAEDILEGKTAYVDGELIEGTFKGNEAKTVTKIYVKSNSNKISVDLRSINGYQDFSLWKDIFPVLSYFNIQSCTKTQQCILGYSYSNGIVNLAVSSQSNLTYIEGNIYVIH